MQKTQRLLAKPAVVVALLGVLGVTAHAGAILMFTSRDAFQSYVGSPQSTYNFTGIDSDGVTLNALNIGGLLVEGQFVMNQGAMEFPASPQTSLAMNFASGGVFAWGADIDVDGPGQIALLTGGRQSAAINISGLGFVGFVGGDGALLGNGNTLNFGFAAIDPTGATRSVNFVIDNIIVNAVPEPTTLLLLATGAGLFGLSRRRRSAKNAEGTRSPEGESPDAR